MMYQPKQVAIYYKIRIVVVKQKIRSFERTQ